MSSFTYATGDVQEETTTSVTEEVTVDEEADEMDDEESEGEEGDQDETAESSTDETAVEIEVEVEAEAGTDDEDEADDMYDDETEDAYDYAFEHGITTLASLSDALPFGEVYRRDAAKMMVGLAMSLHKTGVVHESCTFEDISDVEQELQTYIVEACRLGLMGLHADGSIASTFRPHDTLTRAELGTLLSRMLRGDTHNSTDANAEDRYAWHLSALHTAGIIKDVSTPAAVEMRVYARLILMRFSMMVTALDAESGTQDTMEQQTGEEVEEEVGTEEEVSMGTEMTEEVQEEIINTNSVSSVD